MNKLISLTVFLFLHASCTQNHKSVAENSIISATDSAQYNSTQTDTAQLNLDGVKVSPENFKILSENEFIRVVEYSLKPGKKDQWHTHPPKSGYIVSGGTLKIYPENGEPFVSIEKAGDTFWSNYVGKHHDENIGNTTITIILTEIKSCK